MQELWQAYQILESRADQMSAQQREGLSLVFDFLREHEANQQAVVAYANTELSLEALALLWKLYMANGSLVDIQMARLHLFGIGADGCRKGLWELVEIGDLVYSFSDNGHNVHAKIKPAGQHLIDAVRCRYQEHQTRFNNAIIQAASRHNMFESQILAQYINLGLPGRLIQALVI